GGRARSTCSSFAASPWGARGTGPWARAAGPTGGGFKGSKSSVGGVRLTCGDALFEQQSDTTGRTFGSHRFLPVQHLPHLQAKDAYSTSGAGKGQG
ncbi:unnamed protein product, partial [Amoebophrya sp. A25]